jgi:hypothetical protein
MSKIGIIKAIPMEIHAESTDSNRSRYGMATREAATLMVVRSYEKIPLTLEFFV